MKNRKEFFRTNILTLAINELIYEGLLSLEYHEDEKIGYETREHSFTYDGMFLRVRYHHIGSGEYSIHVTGCLKEDKQLRVEQLKNFFWVYGWLERKTGIYIMTC